MASPPEIGTLVCKINHQWALWLAKIIKAASQFQVDSLFLKACFAYLKCLKILKCESERASCKQ